MFKPPVNIIDKENLLIREFQGYRNNLIIDENAFSFDENMSSDNYPVLSPRNKRAFFNVSGGSLQGLFSKTKLCYINNGSLYYGGEQVPGPVFSDISAERIFVSMGALLIIFPDKIYINTNDLSDYGYLEAEFNCSSATVSLCRSDGDLYEGYTVGASAPENPVNGDCWLDTSVVPNVLKQFVADTSSWIEIADNCVRITAPGVGVNFNQYDGIFLEGFSSVGLEGSFIIRDKGDDYIVVSGMISQTTTVSGSLKVERKIPDVDFICENSNRLWGCNSQTNEIFASKLGDPFNFYAFEGISTDSYFATVGTDGEFTGAVSYRGYVLFFKENCVHKIYGSNPPYTITTSYIRGVQKGSHKSLCILNESLYYKSPNGVCVYEGGMPMEISAHLENEYYTNAVAGGYLNKYYICMSDKRGNRVLFSYDERRGIWHREGVFDVREFACNNLNLYFICQTDTTRQMGIIDSENAYGNFLGALEGYYPEDEFQWCVETGLWGLSLPRSKYYSAFLIRAVGEKNARLEVYYEINSSGKWVEALSENVWKTGSLLLPFSIPRCDHLKLRFEGIGNIKILSVSRNVESGSELIV